MLMEKCLTWIKLLLGSGWLLWQFYLISHPFPPMIQQPVHVLFAMSMVLLWVPLKLSWLNAHLARFIDILLLLLVAASAWYIFTQEPRLTSHMETVDPIFPLDIAFFLIMCGILIECVRRVVGWSLLGVIFLFILYAAIGPYCPGWLRFSGFSLEEMTEFSTMTPNGIFGTTTITSVLYVFYFIVFGAVYASIGGSRLFIDIGLSCVGKATGGAAKASIVSSCLMGSVSGSAVANVASTGVFTIPLMKSSGLSGERAGAVEALASTGGQLMPPVMGVVAFVMAELLQKDYSSIALAGLIPACAYYMALFCQVDLEARKTGIGTITAEKRVVKDPIVPRLYLLIPPITLVALLCMGYSATLSAYYATLICIPTAFLRRKTWLTLHQVRDILMDAGKQAGTVAVPIAAIGLIVVIAVQSNLALKFSTRLMDISGGTLAGALILVVLGCLIMGMGLPTVAAYIIGAVLFVPALKELGIPELSAHFFVMYYCVLSMITPPVALASYTAAGLAKADTTKTGLEAFKMSMVVFLIPVAVVFDPSLLFEGSGLGILAGAASLLLSCCTWSATIVGWLKYPLHLAERMILGLLSLGVIIAPTGSMEWILMFPALLLFIVWLFLFRARFMKRSGNTA